MSSPQICQWQPPAGATAGGACQLCGHSTVAHVGVTQCAVCYLVAVGQAYARAARTFGENLRRMADGVRDQQWPNT